jgi:hypothetical protein
MAAFLVPFPIEIPAKESEIGSNSDPDPPVALR